MALEEGPEQDYAQMARHGASLRRYYLVEELRHMMEIIWT
jgi:hypothetical protein